MLKQHQKTFALIFLIIIICVIIFFAKKDTATKVAIQQPNLPQFESQNSGDGKEVLRLKKHTENGQTTYTFSVSSKANPIEEELLVKSTTSEITYSIPPNSWSPDNNYVFVKEQTASTSGFYVLPIKSEVTSNLKELNIAELFTKKYPSLTLIDITGWASATLLILTTKNEQEKGPSFWFDIPSRSFTQLSTRF